MVEIESSGQTSRAEVAAFLRQFVEELEGKSQRRTADTGQSDPSGAGRADRTGAADDPDRSRIEVEQSGNRDSDDDRTDRPTDADRQGDADREPNRGDDREITFVVGGDSATVTIPESIEFDVEVQSRSPMLKSTVSQVVDFKLSWKTDKHRGEDTIAMK